MNMLNKILADNIPHLKRCILEELRPTLIWDALIPKGKLPKVESGPFDGSPYPVSTPENPNVPFRHIGKPIPSETGKEYPLEVSHIKSPYVCLSDISTSESVTHRLSTVQRVLQDCVKWTQHRRLETSFEKTSGGIITCDGTHKIQRFAHGDDVTTIDPSTITHGLSGGDIQATWDRISLVTGRGGDYGRRDGEPQHALVMGSKSFLSVEKEPPFMDSKLFPLRYSHSIRSVGPMIHLVNSLPPRYTEIEGKLVRVEPFTPEGKYNTDYDTAEFEVAYALHKSAMEYQVPSDDPENYLFDAQWINIVGGVDPLTGEELNPLGDKGFFLLTVAGAMCPRNVEAAITLIYRRA